MVVLIIGLDSFLAASFNFSFSAAASLSAFFFSYSTCLQFSSCARMNILTKLSSVDTTIEGGEIRKTTKRKNLYSDFIVKQCFPIYLVRTGNVPGLLRSIVPTHLHFYPGAFRFRTSDAFLVIS